MYVYYIIIYNEHYYYLGAQQYILIYLYTNIV